MLEKFQALSGVEIVVLLAAGIFGLLWHYLTKIVELRRVNHDITLRRYFVDHVPETILAVLTLLGGIIWLIERSEASVVTVLLLAYTIDSHANKFRSRGQGTLG